MNEEEQHLLNPRLLPTNNLGDELDEEDSQMRIDFDDNEDTIEWTDAFDARQMRELGSTKALWRNVLWDILWQKKNEQLFAYVGFDYANFPSHDPSWDINLKITITILTLEGKFLGSGVLTHLFKGETAGERVDRGKEIINWSVITSQVPSGTFKIRATLSEIFSPAVVPLNYNSKSVTGMVGLENLGATCYLNALLQMLYHINGFRRTVYHLPHAEENLRTSTTLALQSVFKNLQFSNREVSTKDLTTAFGWTSAEAFMQQDVQEMMRVLLDKLEDRMKGTSADGYIKSLFSGTARSFIRCVDVNYESKRDEDFYDIQLDVKGCSNIRESFEKYTTSELLNEENQYDAGPQYGKQDAHKGVVFTKFPPVLTIHLKRFEFDMNSMNFTKIHDRFEFPRQLCLNEFLVHSSEDNSNSQGEPVIDQTYHLHSVLVHSGEVGGGHYYAYIRPSALPNAVNSTEKPIVAGDVDAAASAAGMVDRTAESSWLQSVLAADAVHLKNGGNRSGGGGGGVGNSNPASTSAAAVKWFKFNDEHVLEVKAKEAVEHCYGRSDEESAEQNNYFKGFSSAYMLVYIRATEAPQIMRPVETEDIPVDLVARLDLELRTLREKRRIEERQNMFINVRIATEADVMNFQEYSKADLFFSERQMRQLRIMNATRYLGVLRMMAKSMNVRPIELRLWTVRKIKMQNAGFSPTLLESRISYAELIGRDSQLDADEKLYVERTSFIPNGGFKAQYNLQAINKLQTYFDEGYAVLEQKERDWLDRLRGAILECDDDHVYEPGEDPVAMCGVGMGNQPMHKFLRRVRSDVAKELHDRENVIALDMVNLFVDLENQMNEVDTLVFLRLYDPRNMVASLIPSAATTMVSKSTCAELEEQQTLESDDDDEEEEEEEDDDDSNVGEGDDELTAGGADNGRAERESGADHTESGVDGNGVCADSAGSSSVVVEHGADAAQNSTGEGVKSQLCDASSKQLHVSSSREPQLHRSKPKLRRIAERAQNISALKYIGCIAVKKDATMLQILNALYDMLLRVAVMSDRHVPTASGQNTVDSVIAKFPEVCLAGSAFPKMHLVYQHFAREKYPLDVNLQNYEKLAHSVVLYFSSAPSEGNDNLSDVLRRKIFTRRVIFTPLTKSDVHAYMQHWNITRQMCRSADRARSVIAETETESGEGALQDRTCEVVGPIQRNSIGPAMPNVGDSAVKKRSLTESNETADTHHIEHNNAENFDITSKTRFSANIDLTSAAGLLLTTASAELLISIQYLSLYIVCCLKSAPVSERRRIAQTVVPLCVGPFNNIHTKERPIQWWLAKASGVMLKKKFGIYVFYRLHPYPTIPPIPSISYMNCELAGASIRAWRRRYLDSLANLPYRGRDMEGNAAALFCGMNPMLDSNSNNESDGAVQSNKRTKTQSRDAAGDWMASNEGSYNETAIEWPKNEATSLDVMDPTEVSFQYNSADTANIVCSKILNMIGIPLNIGDLLSPIEKQIDWGGDNGTDEVPPPEIIARLQTVCSGSAPVVSQSFNTESMRAGNGTTPTLPLLASIVPAYCVALFIVRYNQVTNVLMPDGIAAKNFPATWLTCKACLEHLFAVRIQHIPHRDLLLMRGVHPKVKSMMISVCNFTLLGSKVVTCHSKMFSGPFISYVREDDDFHSLAARLREVTGEEDWDKVRLAVVAKDNTAHFVVRPTLRTTASTTTLLVTAASSSIAPAAAEAEADAMSNPTVTTGGGDSIVALPIRGTSSLIPVGANAAATVTNVAAVQQGSAPSVWNLMVSHFPNYEHIDYKLTHGRIDATNEFACPLPTIGIQRSVSDASFGDMSGGRWRRNRRGNSIRIV